MSSSNSLTVVHLTFIQLGGIIGLPLLLIGLTIGQNRSLSEGLLICLIGNGALTLYAFQCAPKVIERRCTTSEHMQFVVGDFGRAIMALLIGSSMLIWFAMQTEVITQSMCTQHQESFSFICGGVLILASLKGLKAIERLSRIIAPLMATAILLLLFTADSLPKGTEASFSFGDGVATVVGGAILGVIDLPTFWNRAKDVSTIRRAAIICFFIAVTSIELCGLLLANKGLASIQTLTHSKACFLLLLPAFIANMTNLYSAAKSAQAIFPRLSEQQALVLAGLLGTALTLFHLSENLSGVVSLMATAIATFGMLLLCDTLFTSSKKSRWIALLSGLAVGLFNTVTHQSFSGLPLLDAMLTAALCAAIGRKKAVIHGNT